MSHTQVLGPSHSLTDITECDINDTQCDTDTQGSTPQQQGPASTSHTATHSQPNTSRTRVCVPRGELRLGKTLASSDRSVVRLGSVTHTCDGDTHTMEVVAKVGGEQDIHIHTRTHTQAEAEALLYILRTYGHTHS